jgi:hypothetical protein
MFVQMGLQLISDMSMRIYSEASMAENPLLAAVTFRATRNNSRNTATNFVGMNFVAPICKWL